MAPKPMFPCGPESTSSVPDRLPTLEVGTHGPSDGRMNVLEAATWLAGEEWGDQPHAVHPAIARIMRSVVAYPANATAELWPLLLASVGSASGYPKPSLWIRGVRARARVRRNPSDAVNAWRALVRRRVLASGKRSSGRSARRLADAIAGIFRFPPPGLRQDRDVWIDTFSY